MGDSRKIVSTQWLIRFPWIGVEEKDNETAQAATKLIEALHTGASVCVPKGGGWIVEKIWSVKMLAWLTFWAIVIHGVLVGAGLAVDSMLSTP